MSNFRGLLDALRDPKNSQGMLDMGMSLMGASGPSPVPMSFGQRLASGYVGSQQMAMQRAIMQQRQQQGDTQQKLAEAQIARWQRPDAAPDHRMVEVMENGKRVYRRASESGGMEVPLDSKGEAGIPGEIAIAQMLADPNTPPELRKQLQAVLAAKYPPNAPWIGQVAGGMSAYERPRDGSIGAPIPLSTPGQERDASSADAAATTTATAKASSKAAAEQSLPAIERSTTLAIETIDKLSTHPGIKSIFGAGGVVPFSIPGSDQAGALALLKQVGGQTFLEARAALKGGGTITDYEGQKGVDAMSRLDRAQKVGDAKDALRDMRLALETGRKLARKNAGIEDPTDTAVSAPKYREGQTATNPKTNEVVVYRNGKWVKQ